MSVVVFQPLGLINIYFSSESVIDGGNFNSAEIPNKELERNHLCRRNIRKQVFNFIGYREDLLSGTNDFDATAAGRSTNSVK